MTSLTSYAHSAQEFDEQSNSFISAAVRQVHMTLNITITHPNDFGRYQCVSKNEMGITKGTISVFGQLIST